MKLTKEEEAIIKARRAAAEAEAKTLSGARKYLAKLSDHDAVEMAQSHQRWVVYCDHVERCPDCDDEGACRKGADLLHDWTHKRAF